MPCPRKAKLLLVGPERAGKTTLLHQFCTRQYVSAAPMTLGVDLVVMGAEDERSHGMSLQLWDTAGHERYASVSRRFYKDAAAALVVFDLTDLISFQAVDMWLSDLRRNVPEASLVLVGNKADQPRQVSQQNACEKAALWNIPYVETSAMSWSSTVVAFDAALTAVTRKTR